MHTWGELYRKCLTDCVRYLGYTVEEFEKLDLPDFFLLMDAMEYRENDKSFWVHFLAWQNMRARGTKKSGKNWKTAFPRFKSFYNADVAKKNIEKSRKKEKGGGMFDGLGEYLRKKGVKRDG